MLVSFSLFNFFSLNSSNRTEIGTMCISVFSSCEMPKIQPVEYYRNRFMNIALFFKCVCILFLTEAFYKTRKISCLRYQSFWT